MKEIVSTITSKGQVTIPAEVRRHLGVHQGDKLSFVIDDNGAIEIKLPQYPTVASLAGKAQPRTKGLSDRDMKEIAHEDRMLAKHGQEV
jgi:antitoxin PrlF